MDLFDPGAVAGLESAVVGRRREVEVVAAALGAGRHVLLEGPPGTGKSTLLEALARAAGTGFVFVEGNAELTPARLVGHHDPSRVLEAGYLDEHFVDGPLLRAMRDGALLYIEEINRIPEETLNALVGVMSAGSIHVPRLGVVAAAPGFHLVAAMNPFDSVGTARISSSIYDRICRVAMDYQSDAEEIEIVRRRAGEGAGPGLDQDWLARVVDLVRQTRHHPDVRVGSSVRGAIDMALVAERLGRIRHAPPTRPDVSLDAARAALSGRIRLHEGAGRTAEDVVEELWTLVFGAVEPRGDESAPGPGPDEVDEDEGLGVGQTESAASGSAPPGKDGARAGRVAGA